MNYLDYLAHYTDVVMHAYIRYKDYTNYLLYNEPDTCMQAIKELQTEAQFGFSVNQLKRLLLADGLERLEERIQIMGWEITDTDYRCLLQIRQSENDFYKERLDFFKKELGDDLGQEYATRLYMTLQAITLNTACIIEMRTKLLGYVAKSQNQQTISTDANKPQLPDELATPDAMKIWDKAKKADWINDDYSFKGTKYQMAYAAEIMGQALGLKHKWKPFISLWKHKTFAQTRRESKERFGYVDREKEIEEAFSL